MMGTIEPHWQLRGDSEEEKYNHQQRENVAEEILSVTGEWLRAAEHGLADIAADDVLGTAIVRAGQQLAQLLVGLADEIDQEAGNGNLSQLDANGSENNSLPVPLLAQACLEDFQNSIGKELSKESEQSCELTKRRQQHMNELSSLSDREMIDALRAASGLLRDVAATVEAIEQEDADEIADVALTVAQLFVTSLQSVHSQLTPRDILLETDSGADSANASFSRRIEILDEDETDTRREAPSSNRSPSLVEQGRGTERRAHTDGRLRILWPPLGPEVSKAMKWGREASEKKPILAVALGLTLWPAAAFTALWGVPLVLGDGLVQDLYDNFRDTPVIHGIERSAAQLFHTGRLMCLSGKLVGKQGLRLANRQVQRHGGVGQIFRSAGDIALDRITHPIDTIGSVWNSVAWGIGSLHSLVQNATNEEKDATVQELQQY